MFGDLSSKDKKNVMAGCAACGADLWARGGPAEEKKKAARTSRIFGPAVGPR